MKDTTSERLKTISQVLAILGLAGILVVIFHKAFVDISALAKGHPADFWMALARYLFRNLAGG